MFDTMLSQPSRSIASHDDEMEAIHGVVIGTLASISVSGTPEITYPGLPADKALSALATQAVSTTDIGRELALSFVGGNPSKPIILGFLHHCESNGVAGAKQNESVNVNVDGESVTLTGKKKIVLKCGKASITLTDAGKIIIKGAYLSSHSTGVNRIRGGSVQIN